jgi:Cu(I)/Ag(I) efflux system membrane fusion protein
VLSTGERNLVFVKRGDGMLEPRLVEVGVATDDRIQILRGVAAGDTVVASATFLVDAESNLGTTLGGMGNMPGMDMTAPTKDATPPRDMPPARDTSGRPPNGGGDHAGHEE